MLDVFTVLTTGFCVALKLVDLCVDVDAAVAAGTIDAVTSIASIAARTRSAGLSGRPVPRRCRFAFSERWYSVEK